VEIDRTREESAKQTIPTANPVTENNVN
jgi:hypothetical protein